MNAHTLSPWRSALVSEKSWNRGIYDSAGNIVALVKVASAREAERRNADSRLIAAAPELLAELQNVLEWVRIERTPLRQHEIDSIARVIAKATEAE